jgi:hypothetical protein
LAVRLTFLVQGGYDRRELKAHASSSMVERKKEAGGNSFKGCKMRDHSSISPPGALKHEGTLITLIWASGDSHLQMISSPTWRWITLTSIVPEKGRVSFPSSSVG